MKKAIALFFCLQILSGNAFAMEFAKLPFMVQHYFEHERAEHPDLSFFDFISEHYSDQHHEDEATGHCDEKMPFKHCNDCCTHSSSITTFLMPDGLSPLHYEISSLSYQVPVYSNAPVGYVGGIWQPPKVG